MSIVALDVHDSADEDIEQLWLDDPEAAACVQVVLEQLEADPCALDILMTRGNIEVGENTINLKWWESAGRNRNIWRIRILDTPATTYRIFYGYHWQTKQLCVLAVVKKPKDDDPNPDFDYDNLNSPISQRIIADWDELTQ